MIPFAYFILTTKSSYLYNESGGGESGEEVESNIEYITNKVIR